MAARNRNKSSIAHARNIKADQAVGSRVRSDFPDRELGQALRDLDVQFGRWRNGEINATELNNVIHQFHDGVSREVADVVNEGVIFSVQDLSVAWESNFASPAHAAVRQLAEAEQGALRRAYAEALAREERERPEALSRAGILYALARR